MKMTIQKEVTKKKSTKAWMKLSKHDHIVFDFKKSHYHQACVLSSTDSVPFLALKQLSSTSTVTQRLSSYVDMLE